MKDSHENLDEICNGFKIEVGERERTVLYIYNKTKNYVIFEIKETGQITYKTAPDFEDNTYKIALKLDKVESYLGEDKTLWCEYKNTMADIYALYLTNNPEKISIAEQLLNMVISELDYNKYSKLYYLLPCVIAVCVISSIALFCQSYNYYCLENHWITIDHRVITVLYMLTFGGIGGLLSVAIGIDKHQDKITRIKWQRVFSGVFRMIIAMLSGLVVYVLYRSDFFTGFNSNSHAAMKYALAIIAGFSQNLIPNLVTKGESIVDSGKK